ncbi:MAG TPA: hypothetical protein VJJ26_00295 [Candidatus Babeliales bacterium]|nr:hypothetical protein [Candidatus Babeliales bacterium]
MWKRSFFIVSLVLCFSWEIAFADNIDADMLRDCTELASHIEKSSKQSFAIEDLEPLFTWRASCAEKPPTGKGNVKALCEGNVLQKNGTKKRIFFWSKTNQEKLVTGYYWCN